MVQGCSSVAKTQNPSDVDARAGTCTAWPWLGVAGPLPGTHVLQIGGDRNLESCCLLELSCIETVVFVFAAHVRIVLLDWKCRTDEQHLHVGMLSSSRF